MLKEHTISHAAHRRSITSPTVANRGEANNTGTNSHTREKRFGRAKKEIRSAKTRYWLQTIVKISNYRISKLLSHHQIKLAKMFWKHKRPLLQHFSTRSIIDNWFILSVTFLSSYGNICWKHKTKNSLQDVVKFCNKHSSTKKRRRHDSHGNCSSIRSVSEFFTVNTVF